MRLRRGWTQVEATSTLTRPPSLTGTFSMRSATGAMRILLFDSGDKLIYESPATMVSVGPGLQEGNVILNVSPPQPAAFEARRVGVIHHNTDIPPEQIPLYVALDDQSIPTFMQFNPRTWTMQSLVSDVPQLSFAFSERVA